MKQDLLHRVGCIVLTGLLMIILQPIVGAGSVTGQTLNDFPDQQIRFTPTMESQQILDELRKNFNPERGGENGYPPIWDNPRPAENIHGFIISLESNPRINNIPLAQNDYIGGFYTDDNGNLKCGGAIYWPDTAAIVFALYGDDNKTPEKDGFAPNEIITFKLFSFENMKDYLVDIVAYDLTYPAKGKWAPLGLSRVINMQAIENIDFYISSSANPVCEGNQIVLQGNEFIGSGGPYTFNWSSDPPGFNYTTQFPPPTTPLETTAYHLTVTDGGLQSDHELTVLVNSDPAVTAGNNTSVCANAVLQLNGTSVNTAATLWTTSGDGTFADNSTLITTYTPGTLDNVNGQALLTLTGLPLNPCDDVAQDNLVATILRLPIVNTGSDKTVCTNEEVILQATAQYHDSLQWTTSGTGTFSSPTTLTTQYFGTPNDIQDGVTLTLCSQAIDPCVATVCDAMHVTYAPGPTASGPSTKTYCENQTVSLNGSATNYSSMLWSTQGDGTFSSPTTFVTLYYPGPQDRNNAGVIVTLTAFALGNCSPATKNVNINLIQLPKITSYGNDGSMCVTDAFTQLDATIQNYGTINWSTSGDGTFNSKTIANPKYYPGVQDRQNKNFTLSLTLSPLPYCATATTGTHAVAIQDNPLANAGADATICSDHTITLSDASGANYLGLQWSTSGSGTFSNPALLKPTYTPSNADINSGSVQLTLTAAPISPCAVDASDSRLLTIIKVAEVNAGADAQICETGTHTLNGIVNYSPGFVWSTNGDGAFSNTNISNPVYTPGSADKAAGNVTLTLTAQQNAPCVGTPSDAMQLTIQRDVAANAGTDATICETTTHPLSSASASNYTSLLWSTNGDGTFSSTTTLKPTYTPGVADKNSGSVVLTLQATAISPCNLPKTSTKTLTIIRNVTANAGSNAQICETNTFTLSGMVAYTNSFIWTTSGDGTFSNPNALASVYTPGNSDKTTGLATLTLTAQQNAPCAGTPSDAMQLTIQRDVVANAGTNATICETTTHPLSTASASNYTSLQWSTSGDGTFSNATILKPTYTPGVADKNSGSVVLTLKATAISPCSLPKTSTKTLTIIRNVTASAGSDAQICETNTYTLSGMVAYTNSFIWTTSGDGTFNNPTALAPIYTPGNSDKTTGLATLTLTAQQNAPCAGTPSDAMQLTIQPDVAANAGTDATICETTTHQLSSASASNYTSLLWSTNGDGTFSSTTTLKPTYTPGVADKNSGSVVLTLKATAISPCSLPKTSTKTLTIIRNVTANAGSDAQICETNTYTLSGMVAYTNSFIWTTSGDGTFNNPTALAPIYTPGNSDKTTGLATLTLTAQQNAPCAGTPSDAMQLTIQPDVAANAGTNATICETTTHQLSSASASNYTSLLWSTNGDGTFSSTTTLKPTYTPGVADKNSGSVVLTLKATAISPCSLPKTSTKTLTIIRNVTANAGSDAQICETNTYTLSGMVAYTNSFTWTTSGDGTFSNPNALAPVYTPGNSDKTTGLVTLTLTAQQNAPCVGTPSDAMQLTIQRDVAANAGINATICETTTHPLSTASASNYTSLQWSTSGDGTFSNATILKPTYTPGVADKNSGSVVLTLKATAISPCSLPKTSTKTLAIIRNVTANAGSDAQICETNTYTLSGMVAYTNSFTWTTSGDGTFSNPNALAPVYTPGNSDKTTGLVTLTLTAQQNAPCVGTPSDAMQLVIKRNAVANAGSDAAVCETSSFTLNGSVLHSAVYAWSTSGDGAFSNVNIQNPVYTPGANDKTAGTVTLTLTAQQNAPCVGSASDAMMLSIQPSALANAGTDATICETDTHQLLTASASNYTSLLWSTNGDGTFSSTTTLKPTYTPGVADKNSGNVVLTLKAVAISPCSLPKTDTKTLTIKRNAVANAGADAAVCETSSFTLNGSVLHSAVYAWSTSGDGAFSNVNIQNPVYTPGANDKTAGTVTLTLTAQQNAPCVGSASDAMMLSIQPSALANAGTDATICETDTHQLLTASASNYTSLLWSTNGDGTFSSTTTLKPTYTPGVADKNSGNVVLTLKAVAISPCSLPKTDTKTLTIIRSATANAGEDAAICENDIYSLTGSVGNATGFVWSTSGNGTFSNSNILNPTYTPGTADKLAGTVTLTLTAQSQSPCNVNANNSMVLNISPMPVVSAGDDFIVCANGGQLSGSAQHYTTVNWTTTGDGTFSNAASLSPVYYPGPQDIEVRMATLRMAAGSVSPCTSIVEDQVRMIIDVPQITSSSVNNQLLKTGNILVLTFNVSSAQPGQYTWYANGNVIPGQTGRIMIIYNVMPANAGEYQAVFTNPCGVVESNVAMVTVLQPYAQQLTIPEGWSGFSSFVTPFNPALETVFAPIANDMILMANNSGIYWPGQNINTLGNLEITEGYKIKMQNSAQVAVSGNVSYPLSLLTIPAGWSYLPVNTPCEENVEQFAAFPQIAMIKDIAGTGIYWPEMGINTIGNLIPGKAYFILNNSASPVVMKYQGCNGFKTSMVMPASAVASPWPIVAATPVTHVFGFTREALAEFTDGDIIGAFDAKGNCMGAMMVDKMQYTNSLVVFGADNTDEVAKGMDVGELVRFRSLRQLQNAEVEMEVGFASRNASDGYFMENGISVVDRAAACVTGIETYASIDAAQIKVYPNPTRGELTIALGNVSLRDASVIITNQNGQVMLRRELQETNTQLNLEDLPRGIYHLRITTGTFVKVERIILN